VLNVTHLASAERTVERDRALGATLAFVAGATNAGGFLAVGQYTSHMTGIASTLADDLALGRFAVAGTAVLSLLAFIAGAMTTAVSVNWARRRELASLFAAPLVIEALLLLAFGAAANHLRPHFAFFTPFAILLLCYLMGLQNAVITKVSHAEIRTTHVTGLVTDIGIELGRLVYVNRSSHRPKVLADRVRLRVHLLLLGSFLVGGILGALGFKIAGPYAAIPLAALLFVIALRPILHDLRRR
jgi:uncharacterized membrane protein YoaK (UPF0700 family)